MFARHSDSDQSNFVLDARGLENPSVAVSLNRNADHDVGVNRMFLRQLTAKTTTDFVDIFTEYF